MGIRMIQQQAFSPFYSVHTFIKSLRSIISLIGLEGFKVIGKNFAHNYEHMYSKSFTVFTVR